MCVFVYLWLRVSQASELTCVCVCAAFPNVNMENVSVAARSSNTFHMIPQFQRTCSLCVRQSSQRVSHAAAHPFRIIINAIQVNTRGMDVRFCGKGAYMHFVTIHRNNARTAHGTRHIYGFLSPYRCSSTCDRTNDHNALANNQKLATAIRSVVFQAPIFFFSHTHDMSHMNIPNICVFFSFLFVSFLFIFIPRALHFFCTRVSTIMKKTKKKHKLSQWWPSFT